MAKSFLCKEPTVAQQIPYTDAYGVVFNSKKLLRINVQQTLQKPIATSKVFRLVSK
jgi:hypothetical protein